MREKGSSPIGVGVLTVLTVLLVLILAVFSALTYTSARPIWPSPGPTRIRFQPTMPRTARPRDFSTHSAGTPTRSWRPRFP